MKVSDILEYEIVDYIEKCKVELVRHVKQRDYVITSSDAASGAGCTLLQIFQKCKSHEEAAAMEQAIRSIVYEEEFKQGDVYPEWWSTLGEKFGVGKALAILKEGLGPAKAPAAAAPQASAPPAGGLPIIGLLNPQAYMTKYIEELRARSELVMAYIVMALCSDGPI